MFNLEDIVESLVHGNKKEAKKRWEIRGGDFHKYLRPGSVVKIDWSAFSLNTPPNHPDREKDLLGVLRKYIKSDSYLIDPKWEVIVFRSNGTYSKEVISERDILELIEE